MANEEQRLRAGLHGRKDPIQKALREQSTHEAAGTRISVYERLGLNKPGFWADEQDRKLKQEEDNQEYEAPKSWTPPETLQYKSQNVEYGQQSKSKGITLNKMGSMESGPARGTSNKGDPRVTKQFKTQLNAVVANNWKSLSKSYPMLNMSSSNMLAAEKIGTSYALAQAFGAALQKDPHAMLNKVATEYYFNKADAAAVARENIPFGHGLPTQFEQMQAVLKKDKKEVKGNTGGVGIQEMKQKEAKSKGNMATPKRIQGPRGKSLNVHANSYANQYMTPNIFS